MRRLACTLVITCLLIAHSAHSSEGMRHSFDRVHLMFGYGLAYGGATGDIRDAFYESGFGGSTANLFGGRISYPLDESDNWSGRAEVLYQWSDRWRVGFGIRGLPAETIVGKQRLSYASGPREAAKGSVYCLVVDFLVLPVKSGSPWEFSVGGGLCYTHVTVDGNMGSYFQDTVYVDSEPWEVSRNAFGGLARLNLDLYLQSSVSLQLRLAGYFVSSIDVPSQTFYVWELEAHSINSSSFETTLGLSLHL